MTGFKYMNNYMINLEYSTWENKHNGISLIRIIIFTFKHLHRESETI